MRNFNLRLQSLDRGTLKKSQMVALPVFVGSFMLAWLPVTPAQATYYNPPPYRSSERDYRTCADGLLGTGLKAEDAAAACAAALYPRALSACVTTIDRTTELTATDALSGCRRVRRPQELASCVVNITGISTTETKSTDVLDYCRRSLLPVRFSNCVVGLAGQAKTSSTTEMMTTCIAASSRPRQVLPDFIPRGQEIPLQPLPGTADADGTADSITAPSLNNGFSTETPAPAPSPSSPRTTVPGLW